MPLCQNILSFKLLPEHKDLLSNEETLSQLDQMLTSRGLGSRQTSVALPDGRLVIYLDAERGRHATVRSQTTLPFPVLIIDVTQPVANETTAPAVSWESLNELYEQVKALFKCRKLSSLNFPPIHHGTEFERYFPSVDNRIAEYDFNRLVFEADTPHQNVKILHSDQYGNTLVLDNDINLAESDIAYTKAITGSGRESYEGKRVLILGGGDGGILNFLLPQSPKFVEMIEIDQVVIDQAVKHLRGICGSAMDSLSGSNYKIRVEDCVPVLEQFAKDGVEFDYIINDLTAIPISTSPHGSFWDFMRLILQLSFQVLAHNGKYFTQGNSVMAVNALAMYEGELAKLEPAVDFSKEWVCVPSYQEMWVFYEMWRKS